MARAASGQNSPYHIYTLMSCKFVKTTQKNDQRVTLLWKYQLGGPWQTHIEHSRVTGGEDLHSNHDLNPAPHWKPAKHLQQTDFETIIFHWPGYKPIPVSVTILFLWHRSVCSPCLSPSAPLSQRPKCVLMEAVLSGENKCQRKAHSLLPFKNTCPPYKYRDQTAHCWISSSAYSTAKKRGGINIEKCHREKVREVTFRALSAKMLVFFPGPFLSDTLSNTHCFTF